MQRSWGYINFYLLPILVDIAVEFMNGFKNVPKTAVLI